MSQEDTKMSQCDILGCTNENNSTVTVTVLNRRTHNVFVHLCPRHNREYWELIVLGKKLFWNGECLTDTRGKDVHDSVGQGGDR